MNTFKCLISYFFMAFFLYCSMFAKAVGVPVVTLDFEDVKIPTTGRCGFGSQQGGDLTTSNIPSQNYNKSKGSLKGTYPISTGGMYVWGGCDLKDLNINDVYIEFQAKMPLPTKQGLKFLKIFGQRNASGYANTTVGLDYTGIATGKGSLNAISFGDGTTEINDTQNAIFLNGANPSWVGRSNSVAVLKSAIENWPALAWGDAWHHFRVHIKFNTGTSEATEKADGEYYLEIDGKVYVSAKNILNRHYNNLPIQKISFFDWSQGGTQPFEIWYDDIIISTGDFIATEKPKDVNVQ